MDKQLMLKILSSENPEHEYHEHKKELNSIEIVSFVGEKGVINFLEKLPVFDIPKDFNKITKVGEEKNKITFNELAEYEKCKFFSNNIQKIKYIFEMDVNVASYLNTYYKDLKNKKSREKEKTSEFKSDVEKFLKYIKLNRDNFLLGYHMYLIENIIKNEIEGKEEVSEEIIIDNIEAMEYLFNLQDEDELSKKLQEVRKKAKNEIEEIKKIKKDFYYQIYSLLLKMFLIKNSISDKFDKIRELVKFINNELNIYMEYELLLCLMYLLEDKKIKGEPEFFKESIKGSKMIKYVKGMAWDLAHFRLLQGEYLRKNREGIIVFPIIITADKGMKKVMEINKIIYFYFSDTDYGVVYENNIYQYLSKYNSKKTEKILDDLLRGTEKRNRNVFKTNYKLLSEKIENELKKYLDSKL